MATTYQKRTKQNAWKPLMTTPSEGESVKNPKILKEISL